AAWSAAGDPTNICISELIQLVVVDSPAEPAAADPRRYGANEFPHQGAIMSGAATLRSAVGLLASTVIAVAPVVGQDSTAAPPAMRADGTTHMRAYDLPISRFLSPESRDAFIKRTQ